MSAVKLLVTVGSDHHRFDRLIEWVDDWLSRQAEGICDATVQYGLASPPSHGLARDFFPHDLMLRALDGADIVVTQGGPTGIVEARRRGLVPIVVPRRRALSEHVDDHQVDFCRNLAAMGRVVLAETAPDLAVALDRAVADPKLLRSSPDCQDTAVRQSTNRFAELVAQLPHRKRLLYRRW